MKSFCFVLNPLEVTGDLPVELISGHFLQKADSEQIDIIRDQLDRNYVRYFSPAYEHEWMEEDNKGGRESEALPPEKWRYWVVAYEDISMHIEELHLAVNLLKHDLDLGFRHDNLKGKSYGIVAGQLNASSYFDPSHPMLGGEVVHITTAELSAVREYHQKIKTCQKDHPNIYKTVRDFYQLKALPRFSKMLVLGYFSIIEALVTHDPKEQYDSLNHQISTKMVLLSKRFERQLDYDGHFSLADREVIWKKLYSYRSALAHGSSSDFKTQFKSLKDQTNVLIFLKEAAKLVLLFAMKESELLVDLKKC